MTKNCKIFDCDLSQEACAICPHNTERINCEVLGKCESINTDFCLKSCPHNKTNIAKAFQNLDFFFLVTGYSPFGMY